MPGLAALSHPLQAFFFTIIFQHREKWQWNQLPKSYLEGPYLLMDTTTLSKQADIVLPHEQLVQESDDQQASRDNSPANSDEPATDGDEPLVSSDKSLVNSEETPCS